jgi:hypothetical protein
MTMKVELLVPTLSSFGLENSTMVMGRTTLNVGDLIFGFVVWAEEESTMMMTVELLVSTLFSSSGLVKSTMVLERTAVHVCDLIGWGFVVWVPEEEESLPSWKMVNTRTTVPRLGVWGKSEYHQVPKDIVALSVVVLLLAEKKYF